MGSSNKDEEAWSARGDKGGGGVVFPLVPFLFCFFLLFGLASYDFPLSSASASESTFPPPLFPAIHTLH
jgi:hypothetical protein